MTIRENLLRWIEDLETTTAAQGHFQLRSIDNHYCCLGRACVVADVPWSQDAYGEWVFVAGQGEFRSTLSAELTEFFGLDHLLVRKCIELNDRDGKTFKQIAKWLRFNVLPLHP